VKRSKTSEKEGREITKMERRPIAIEKALSS
jgi:hypothetical protein